MKKKTIFIIGTLLVGAVLLSACGLMEAQGVSPTSERYIRVSGSGEVAVVPDIAYINIGVHSEAEDVSSALEANNTQATKLTEALQAEGIEAKDIQTTNFNVYPQTRYDNMGQPVGTSYVVDNTVYITVRDLTKLGKLLDSAISAGANNIYGISFDIADKETVLAQARELAIKDAEAKAKSVATVAGVTLGQILSIDVSTPTYTQPYYGYGMGGGAEGLKTSVPVSAGQIVVTYTATLNYAIE
ncbi:MAG TPA: SIMPL domain-containing protein [Anaerolineaceae bacterium]|nr:SIMPL domain-containing protein [Anaerolineaceae bacterium]